MTKVILKVYNIGNETLANIISTLCGKQISGIFHTSVEVFGSEYFFQGGITKAVPNTTMFGNPIRIHQMGETKISLEELEEYLEILSNKFNNQSYHLLQNNCNNFSDSLIYFLVEKNVPEYILEVQELASTNETISNMVNMMYKTDQKEI
ncbi:Desumoylating isopeptidase 1 [Nosema granulosis]|uniref:Desumoylating isopeptidase 1 n=1 Tax=Nosema granulosis TaxID=83296 RepID=A0A9P6H3H5_9MICR|nr:Desumoylating isopeptidase 1 [Nosema granulosis]